MTNGSEFREYMKAAGDTLGQDDQHLNEARMVAYYRGQMGADERELAQAHLVSCEQCIALFRSVGEFFEPAGEDEEPIATEDREHMWAAVWQRTQNETPVVREFKPSPGKRRFFDWRVTSPHLSAALAASLLLSFGGLGWTFLRIRQERRARQESQAMVAQLSSKQRELEEQLAQAQQGAGDQLKQEREQRISAETKRDQLQSQLSAEQQNWDNIPVYTTRLGPERGGTDDMQLEFKAAATVVQLLISKPYEYPEFVVEILDQSGQVVREVQRLRPTGDAGALSFRLDRATLKSGKYKLRLLGQRGREKTTLGDYVLSVK